MVSNAAGRDGPASVKLRRHGIDYSNEVMRIMQTAII